MKEVVILVDLAVGWTYLVEVLQDWTGDTRTAEVAVMVLKVDYVLMRSAGVERG